MPLRDAHRNAASEIGLTSVDRAGATQRGEAAPLAGGEPEYIPWGGASCEILATIGSVELEYAAIRRGLALVDAASRRVVRVTGSDASGLIDRLVTAPISRLAPGEFAQAFMLDRTGRIMADLLIAPTEDGTVLIDVDQTDAEAVADAVEAMVFVDDAKAEVDARAYVIEAHGPTLNDALEQAGYALPEPGSTLHFADAGLVVRLDSLGVPGVRICTDRGRVADLWSGIGAAGRLTERPCRTVGWYAFNIARVEAATPWAHIDFGPTSLPHETGLIASRVRFDKGCYPGQEVVARMEHLGHPKQILRCLHLPDERLPVAGGQVFAGGVEGGGDPVGQITSSAPSPMRGGAAVSMAVIRWKHATPGSPVQVVADGEFVTTDVKEIET